jgi:hypothetical protein
LSSSLFSDEEQQELILGFIEEGREMLDEVEPHQPNDYLSA